MNVECAVHRAFRGGTVQYYARCRFTAQNRERAPLYRICQWVVPNPFPVPTSLAEVVGGRTTRGRRCDDDRTETVR
jgi:hypothetical protein